MKFESKLTILILISLLSFHTSGIVMLVSEDDIAPLVSINDMVAYDHAIEVFADLEGGQAGASLATIGDINEDGYDDYVTGAPGADGGRTYIQFGQPNLQNFSLSDANITIQGNGGNFGTWFSDLGDVNNDGVQDIAVSAVDLNGGTVYLFSVDDLNQLNQIENVDDVAFASLIGENEGNRLGHGMRGVGDFNGDGYDDILIGGEFYDSDGLSRSGKAYLIYGRPSEFWKLDQNVLDAANSTFLGLEEDSFFGMDVAGLGDINGDTYTDIAIASRSASHRTSIFFGQSGTLGFDILATDANVSVSLSKLDTVFIGEHLAGNVDLNGDGYKDIILGQYNEADPTQTNVLYKYGKTYIIFGRSIEDWPEVINADNIDASLIGITRQRTGWAAASLPDINNDGYDEILTSELTPRQTGENTIHVIPGRPTNEWALNMNISEVALISISSGTGSGSSFAYGNRVVNVGDVNGDGVNDIGINKWQYNSGNGGLYIVHNLNVPDFPDEKHSDEGENSIKLWLVAPSMFILILLRVRFIRKLN